MLHRDNGDLVMEQVSLIEIAETYGTPTFVYSEAEITRARASAAAILRLALDGVGSSIVAR